MMLSAGEPRATLLLLAAFVLGACINACSGGGGYQAPEPIPSLVSEATIINLYPAGDRLYIYLAAVGSVPMSAPLIFDTGSAGLTLDAHAVFPPSMFDASGRLLFPGNQTPLSVSGVTVMPAPAKKEFGGAGGTTLLGYVGYTRVTFGDAKTQLTTSEMPVFLYDSTSPSSASNPTGYGPAQGIFGVDNLADQLAESFTKSPLAACEGQSSPPCYVASVLKYLSYAPGLDAGFRLAPAELQPCAISSTPGECLPEPMLTVGLNMEEMNGFAVKSLVCPPTSSEEPAYYGPDAIQGYRVCEKSIAGADISISAPMAAPPLASFLLFPGPVLFDTGAPENEVEDSSLPSSITLTAGNVVVTLPVPFTYSYMIDDTNTPTVLQPIVNNKQNHIGVGYFESNYFFLDYTTSTEGWMLGN
jgi:hypothetical protein